MTVLDDSTEPFFLGQHHSFLLEEEGHDKPAKHDSGKGYSDNSKEPKQIVINCGSNGSGHGRAPEEGTLKIRLD